MQKSELGLLSSLLYTLLQQERKLIQVGFKGRFEAALGGQSTSEKPSIFEVRRALKEIVRCNSDIFFFLTVDGLDEFDPLVSTTDVSNLLQLTRSLNSSSNVKMILSSRPLSAFERGFADCPSLAIHTLTPGDIHSYVFDELQSHPRMKMLMSRDEAKATDLIRSVNENSSGVFLWVRLVVQSLLEGLESSDGLEELQVRLEELPHDLHTLYSVMLSRIPSKYLPQTAKLIQIVERATWDGHEFSLLGLWYADQWTDHDLFGGSLNPISQDQIVARTEDMRGRLKSRCLGLVEIQESSITESAICDLRQEPTGDIYDPTDDHLILRVKFIHRTVSEFITKEDIRNKFVDLPSLSAFDPNLALSRGAIAIVKEFIPGKPTDWVVLMKLVGYIQWRLSKNPHDPVYQLKLLTELDTVMSKHLAKQSLEGGDSMGSQYGFPEDEPRDAHWSSWLDIAVPGDPSDNTRIERLSTSNFSGSRISRRRRQASFLSFLVITDQEGALQQMINTHGSSILRKDGLSLLGYALLFNWPWSEDKNAHQGMIKLLVTNGSSPHEEFCGKTVWDWYCRTQEGTGRFSSAPEFTLPCWAMFDEESIDVQLVLLGAGADIDVKIPWRLRRPGQIPPPPESVVNGQTMTSCTLLLAAHRTHKILTGFVAWIDTNRVEMKHIKGRLLYYKGKAESLLEFLEDANAIEQGWNSDGDLIFPVPVDRNQASKTGEDPAENMTTWQQTATASGPKPHHSDAQVGSESKEEGNGHVKEVKAGIIESASHKSEADPSDEMATAHMARSKGSRMRGKISSWMKSMLGKVKTAT